MKHNNSHRSPRKNDGATGGHSPAHPRAAFFSLVRSLNGRLSRLISNHPTSSVLMIDLVRSSARGTLVYGRKSETKAALQGMKHPLAEQRKTCPTIHRSLDQLELVHLAFHLPVAVDECSSGQDRHFVSLQTVGKALNLNNAALRNLLLPII